MLTTLDGFDDYIDLWGLTFSRDGRLLAAKGGHMIRAWTTGDWREVFQASNGETNFGVNNAVVISPDNTTLATRIKGGIGFWDLGTGRQLEERSLKANPRFEDGQRLGTVMAYSRDGQLLAMDEVNELQLRDARSLTIVTNLIRSDLGGAAGRVMSVAFSDNLLAAGFPTGNLFNL